MRILSEASPTSVVCFFDCLNAMVMAKAGSFARPCDIGCEEGKNYVCVFAFSVDMPIRNCYIFIIE